MADFELPADLGFNRGPIQDPASYARTAGAAAWLCLTGDEFAAMPGGMSYVQVEAAVEHSAQVVSDPREHLAERS